MVDLFNPQGATQEEKNTEMYKPSYKDSKSGVYKAVVRFLPNPQDPSKCVIGKFVRWIKNPMTQKGMYVDDPKDSQASAMYWNLRNTGIATYVDFANTYLGGKQQYASLVQIMADDQHPELVGQIKVFVYGKKIHEKLHNEEYPAMGTGIKPFHPYLGRKFMIVCTNQSNFNNFDQSCFFDERNGSQIMPSGMWYIDPANPNQFSIVDENTDGQVLLDYLLKNAPDLSKYDYHPMTDEQTKHVQDVLAIATNMLTTGTMGTTQQTAYVQPQAQPAAVQPAFPGSMPMQPAYNPNVAQPMQPTYNPNPVFPGATMPQQPAAPAQQPQVPSGMTTLPPNVAPPVAGTISGGMPQVPSVPQGNPQVSGVTPPNVAPQGAAPGGVQPPTGMNMDDILSQL